MRPISCGTRGYLFSLLTPHSTAIRHLHDATYDVRTRNVAFAEDPSEKDLFAAIPSFQVALRWLIRPSPLLKYTSVKLKGGKLSCSYVVWNN